jgi:antitoxin Phd
MLYPLQDAKARFSELVGLCLKEGPQTVTRHGRKTAVLLSYDDYLRLTAPQATLGAFFRTAPRADLAVDRSRDPVRAVDLG